MRIYDHLNDVGHLVFQNRVKSEFEIQANLYSRLTKDGFTVRGNYSVGIAHFGGAAFDLVVFEKREAIAIIEVKSALVGPQTDLDLTAQGLKYRSFGIPVILFWDLKEYSQLVDFLKTRKIVNSPVRRPTYSRIALERLCKSLDISSMRAYDAGLHEMEKEIEEKLNTVKELMNI